MTVNGAVPTALDEEMTATGSLPGVGADVDAATLMVILVDCDDPAVSATLRVAV